ncbi:MULTISPECIES: hypothetical protein [Methylobacterium]|uniref:Uncharacterized protein n=1 Tax=Methylobacterium longum TaxID=767694 RepID=A0ABT8AMD1_9HYPH|nr:MULTISPECIES: hypothetical protein [Methylobacterium]MCJ2099759.1 hypothetical protein [Methylobacterium sp. E-046]MDN3570930.1 hypothetical protein [Methylobacterium longum]GJE12040.1 hypothetical protein FOHLNKBM_3086 [Methylobacterium longum]
MTTFDLKDGRRRRSRLRRAWRDGRSDGGRGVLGGWCLSALLCLTLAMLCGPPLGPWMLAGLLSLSGFAWLGLAITQAGPPAHAPHPTAWDAALLSFAASFGVQSAARLGLL